MSWESKNSSVIQGAFTRLRQHEDEIIRRGMYKLLDTGLDYLNEAHGLIHGGMKHTEEDDTLGWALAHDGDILEIVAHSGGEWTPNGDALLRLEKIIAQTKGWVGIILSDMTNNWYRVDYEMDYLAYSADGVLEHFNDCFKPIV